MENTIKEIIIQADDERNFDLIRLVKEFLDEIAYTCNWPSNWRYLGMKLAEKYSEDSWVYENLELWNFVD